MPIITFINTDIHSSYLKIIVFILNRGRNYSLKIFLISSSKRGSSSFNIIIAFVCIVWIFMRPLTIPESSIKDLTSLVMFIKSKIPLVYRLTVLLAVFL